MQRLMHCTGRFGIGLLGGLLLWAGVGGQADAAPWPAEMVSATKHNLSLNSNIGFGTSTGAKGSAEVCVFCHTPHGAGYGNLLSAGMAPLWNRKINNSQSYTVYSSPHFDGGTTLNSGLGGQGVIKGVSLACLSCHDGTIAFDALINLPGSGGYSPQNAFQVGAVGETTGEPGEHALANTLFGGFTGAFVDGTNHTFNTSDRTYLAVPAGNPFNGSFASNNTLVGQSGTRPFPNLTDDLRDDHPISMEIPSPSSADTTYDPQFSELVAGAVLQGTKNLLDLKRSAGVGSTGLRPQDPRDRIRAYPSTAATLAPASYVGAYIECASCHNPHTPRTLFLRLPSNVDSTGVLTYNGSGVGLESGGGTAQYDASPDTTPVSATYWSHAPNQASAICISCHQK